MHLSPAFITTTTFFVSLCTRITFNSQNICNGSYSVSHRNIMLQFHTRPFHLIFLKKCIAINQADFAKGTLKIFNSVNHSLKSVF